MKVLVTGCAGLIGSHLVDDLLASNHRVIGIDNLSYGSLTNIKAALKSKNFEFIKTDVQNISKAFKSIIHLNLILSFSIL